MDREPCIGDLDRVADILNEGQRFLLTCHIRPDGDAIGSMLGLGFAIERAGKEVRYFAQDPVPKGLNFLPGSGLIRDSFERSYLRDAILIVLDCNEPSRIGRSANVLIDEARRVVVLDHHTIRDGHPKGRNTFSAEKCELYICTSACATALIIMEILDRLDWPIERAIATALYTGILTDTGSFRHSNADKKAFLAAARLMDTGIDNYGISNKIYQNYPRQRIELLGLVLNTLRVLEQGLFAIIHVRPEMFEATGAHEEDINGFVDFARSIDTVEVAAFVKEVHPGQVSVSLRSKSYANVARIAQQFGGGGHFHAAAFRKKGTFQEIQEELIQAMHSYFKAMEADRGA